MIPRLDRYELVTPASLAAVLDDLAQHPAARPFAGGTDVMVVLESGHLPAGRYVSLSHCRELLGIEETSSPGLPPPATADGVPGDRSLAGGVSIGALVTYTGIRNSAILAARYPLLPAAARETGGLATQNRGTIGGNIANASPAADTPPVLLVYDAELEIVSATGSRRVPYASFHHGYKKMDLAPGELIARVHLPARSAASSPAATPTPAAASTPVVSTFRWKTDTWTDYYRKVGARRAQAISKVCVAASILMDGDRVADVRIALGSVAPTVVRATGTEGTLRGRLLDERAIAAAAETLASEIAPIDDIRSTALYRARVAANLLREFLQK